MPTIAALHAAGELSTRARNALTNDAGCEVLADVAAMTEEKVRRLANVGAGTVAEIKSVLSANGLAFATESLEEEEEEGPRFEPYLWMVMDPWRDLRMMVRAIDKGIRYPGVSEQRHARFIRDAREVVDHKRKRERRMKAMIGRAVARLPPQDDATAANWIPKAGWDERRLCSTPIAKHPPQALESFTVPQELQAVRIKTAAELLDCEETIIRRLLRKGELRGFKLGRGVRVLVQSIEDYQQRQALPIPEPPVPKPVRRKNRRDTIEQERAMAFLRAAGVRI